MNSFIEYRRNKKKAKRELASMMAATLPSWSKFATNSSDVIDWIFRLIDSTKYVTMDHVLDYTIEQLALAFGASENRVRDMFSYLFSLDGEQITRLVSGAAMASNPDWHVVGRDEDDRKDNPENIDPENDGSDEQ